MNVSKMLLITLSLLFVLFSPKYSIAAGSIEDTVTLKELINNPLMPMQEMVYRKFPDTTLKIYYIKPKNVKKHDKLTAIVWIHGGGWTSGGAETFFAHARYFSLRGAVGFSIEYRLVRPKGSSIADCLDDCRAAIRYIREHAAELNIDPDKIVVLGDSAGGHLAACLGTMIEGEKEVRESRANAMVLCNPLLMFTGSNLLKNVIKHKFANFKLADTASLTPDDSAMARNLSPMLFVKPHLPPCLVMHGLNDKVISPQQSADFGAAMQKEGNVCEVELLENRRHAFVVPKYTATEEIVVSAITDADKFLERQGFLKGEPSLRVGKEAAWQVKK